MDCPNCHQPVEPGAVFCGNCGQQLLSESSIEAVLRKGATSHTALSSRYAFGQLATGGAATAAIPAYAIAKTHTHNHVKIILALVSAVLGISGAFFIPLLGIVLGIIGLVFASLATHVSGRGLRLSGFVLSGLACLMGLAVWVYVAAHNPRLHPTVAAQPASNSAISAIGLSTPCYSLSFPGQLNIENTRGSCEMDAYNGASLANSSNVYKVLTAPAANVSQTSFASVAKKAIESDVSQNLPGFQITSEGNATFSSSPAFYVNAMNASSGVAVEEGAVLHSSANGPTLYVLVHATFGTTTNLKSMEASWQWK